MFSKTATANEWDYRVVANASEITAGTAGELQQINAAGGLIAFNPDGTLEAVNSNITAVSAIAWANGANPQTVAAADMDFTGTTQFAVPSSVTQVHQNGAQSGILKGINIGNDGVHGAVHFRRQPAALSHRLSRFRQPPGARSYR